MSSIDAMLTPSCRLEGLERLDLLDWDELSHLIQSALAGLDQPITDACAGITVSAGSNASRRLNLFSYRVYHPRPETNVDPVVVGISFVHGGHGTIIHGDIAGETLGDILFDIPQREVIGKLAVLETARDFSERLMQQVKIVSLALEDSRRQL